MSDNKSQEMASDRTDWAEDRTVLANERTFGGWIRTGLAAVGLGIAMHAVFGEAEPTWFAKAAATLFILAGLFIFAIAWKKSCVVVERLNCHAVEAVNTDHLLWIVLILSLSACGVIAILWMI